MQLLNPELLRDNCADDQVMMREIIDMGLQSVNDALTGIDDLLEKKDWDNLARILHKLRPVLCYCGITNLSDDLLLIEHHAKERKELTEIPARIAAMVENLQQARAEMEQQRSLLSN